MGTARAALLADRYELTSLIAGGAMGQVWRGRDTLLDRPVAVKVLRDQFAGDPTFRSRFRAEAQHTAVLTHPHIATVFDYGEVPGLPGEPPVAFLVMELVEGESLAEVLRGQPRLGVRRTLEILWQAADGLAAAHDVGVVHRDVKPGNLLVGRDGRVKVTDFGIARSASSVALTGTGQVIGTAHYLSPEQASARPASPASDVYALGAVAYECLAGRRAFEGESAVQVAVMQIRDQPPPLPADVPPDVRALVARAMDKDPEARFADGAALRDAVDAVLAGVGTARIGPAPTAVLPAVPAGRRPAVAPVAEPGRRRGRLLVAALLAALLVAVAIGLVGALLPDDSTAEAGQPTATATAAAGITLVGEDLLGRPVREVQAELVALGLRVELVPVETDAVPAGQVTGADPLGTLAPEDVVRLSYSVTPVPAPAPAPTPAGDSATDVSQGGGSTGPTAGPKGNGGDREKDGPAKRPGGKGRGGG